MGPQKGGKGSGGASPAMSAFHLEAFQQQLNDYSAEENGISQMINLVNDTKKAKMNPEDKTAINMVSILIPFIMATKTQTETVTKLQVAVEKKLHKCQKSGLPP